MAKCIWLTGLPCSGKTTIAKELLKHINAVWLDGDSIRGNELYKNTDFSVEGRRKHILMMGMIAKTLVDQGKNVICSFVSPDRAIRDKIKKQFLYGEFFEVFVNASKDTCVKRDVKGMWKKAYNGEIKNFTGVDGEYERPWDEYLHVNTDTMSLENIANYLLMKTDWVKNKKYAMFVGRWNGVFHNGHDHIIQSKLKEGKNVLLAIRDVEPDEKNTWSAKEVKKMLEHRFRDEPRVKCIIIPDIGSIEYGRGVGYEVNEIKVDKQIAGVSGTECRRLINEGDHEWKNFVPKEVGEFLTERSNA